MELQVLAPISRRLSAAGDLHSAVSLLFVVSLRLLASGFTENCRLPEAGREQCLCGAKYDLEFKMSVLL